MSQYGYFGQRPKAYNVIMLPSDHTSDQQLHVWKYTSTSWRRRSLKRVPRSDLDQLIPCAFLSTCAVTIVLFVTAANSVCLVVPVLMCS